MAMSLNLGKATTTYNMRHPWGVHRCVDAVRLIRTSWVDVANMNICIMVCNANIGTHMRSTLLMMITLTYALLIGLKY